MNRTPIIQEQVSLAPLTTLQVGGAARYFARAEDSAAVVSLLGTARDAGWPVLVLGGGSNLLVSDSGFSGLVVQLCDQEVRWDDAGPEATLYAGAGVVWDTLVASAVSKNCAGLECLSGIPGWVGAAPIQNIGAYGQEVSETIQTVHAVDRRSGESVAFDNSACGFAYRHSQFKGPWKDRFVVTGVTFLLRKNGEPVLRYQQLIDHLKRADAHDLASVRDGVLEIRRQKSMVLDAADPNCRSAGSFFMNPIVSASLADDVRAHFERKNIATENMPSYPTEEGRVKLSAAWLMDRLGFVRGYGDGPVGLSSNHALALINRGQAKASDVIQLAGTIVRTVHSEIGVTLMPEPAFVGFDAPVSDLLGL